MAKTYQQIMDEARQQVPEVSPDDVRARIGAASKPVVLDVREKEEFRQGYVLNYALAGTPDPGWHKLTVTVPRAKYTIRAREGYFAR